MAWIVGALVLIVAGSAWMTQPLLLAGDCVKDGAAPDPERLEHRVRDLVGLFYPRDFTHTENLARAARFIGEEFRRAGAAVSEQLFQAAGESYRNVVAAFGPDTREVIVVGAHYDVAGEFPGADDNASGVAGLLELADLLAGAKLSRRVELAAYALEEMPFFSTSQMGSAIHARSLRAAGRRVRGMLCLEMIGCFSEEAGSQEFPLPLLRLFYPSRGNFIAVVGNLGGVGIVRRVKRSIRRASDLPVHSINAPALVPGVDLSDHVNFWRQGDPAVMITDTAFYRNPRYHTEGDTAETLDYGRMAKVVAGVRQAVLDLAR
ncbi:MAG: M28 family peptidase [Thermoanaerobaculia bacterium]